MISVAKLCKKSRSAGMRSRIGVSPVQARLIMSAFVFEWGVLARLSGYIEVSQAHVE